jgi:type IV secretion system protein TrbL
MLAGVAVLALAAPAHAQSTNLHDASQSYYGLLHLIQTNASSWTTKLKRYAETLFWSLAVIQLVWTFFPLVLKQVDVGEIVGELLRFVLVIGFFYALLDNSVTWGTAIVDSFREAGGAAAGVGKELQPADMFGFAVEMANTIGDVQTWNPAVAIMVIVSGAVVLLCFAFIAAFMGVTLVESYIVINASVLFMGFGGSQWTREYAIAMARYAVAVGAKLFVLTLLVGVIVTSAKEWQTAYNASADQTSMWTMVGLALVCAYLAKQIPDLVQSLITGTSMGGGHALGGMALAGAAGATAAISALATGGRGAAVGASGIAGAGGSLAGLMDASLMGGKPAGSGFSLGGGSGSSAASALSPRVGGAASAANRVATASAAAVPHQTSRNSAAGAPPAASGGDGGAGEEAASSSQERAPGGAQADAAAPGASGQGAQAGQTGARPSGGQAAHRTVGGMVRGAGILAAISVPGMEGAAGLSIGPYPGDPPRTGSSDGEGWGRSDFAAADAENTIRPADTPASPPPPDNGRPA